MNEKPLRALAATLAATAALAACGGGGGDSSSASTDAPNYAVVLSQLTTPEGLASPAAANAFDNAYLDSGMTKQQVVDALSAEGVALAGSADHSLFPQVALENATLSNCDANNVCTLTGTLRNSDADETSVPFTTKVVNTGSGGYRLLGDQQTS